MFFCGSDRVSVAVDGVVGILLDRRGDGDGFLQNRIWRPACDILLERTGWGGICFLRTLAGSFPEHPDRTSDRRRERGGSPSVRSRPRRRWGRKADAVHLLVYRSGHGDPAHPAGDADLHRLRPRFCRRRDGSGAEPLAISGPARSRRGLAASPGALYARCGETGQFLGFGKPDDTCCPIFCRNFSQVWCFCFPMRSCMRPASPSWASDWPRSSRPSASFCRRACGISPQENGGWHLFPGLALVLVVILFALLGDRLRRWLDPASVHA